MQNWLAAGMKKLYSRKRYFYDFVEVENQSESGSTYREIVLLLSDSVCLSVDGSVGMLGCEFTVYV
jgi:hypothetical protein